MEQSDKAGDLERRVSTRRSVRLSLDNGDEDYELALAGMVADGFRPTHSSSRTAPSTPSLTSASTATLFTEESPSSSSRDGRPSSTAKTQTPQYILSIRNEQPNALARQQTTASTESTVYLPNDTPYQGPSGPSHPYQMYPQDVRPARTLSMATSSTMPASESSYRGPRGPSHPYALYSQTDAVESDPVQPAAIPLGFRGLPDQYQRRIGPEGEEIADMIGPDGHTEQLPPYTRYPDEAYLRKAAAVDSSPDVVRGGATIVIPPAAAVPPSTLPSIPGAGGLGLATRNPEFDSTDDLGSPRSRHSTRSFTSDESHRRFRLDDDEEVSEKRKPPKKWQLWMRRSACGIIPYWAICLTGLILLIMAIIVGAVVGTFLNKDKRPPRKPQGSWEPNYDATPIPTPPDLQPLPTGTFAMPLMTNRVSPTCFQNPTLSQAWNCHLVISGMTLTVTKEHNDYRAAVDCNHSYTAMNNVYAYGEQPPLIEKPVTLDLVGDRYEPSRGPAWFKVLPFNKTVILPESVFGSGSSSQNKARHAASISAGVSNFKRKGVAQPGDKPWVCNWPNTYLELFIYAQQNSSFSNWDKPQSTSSFSSSTSSLSSSSTTSTTSATSPRPTPDELAGEFTANDVPSGQRSGGFPSSRHNTYFPQKFAHSAESTTTSSTTTTTPPPPPSTTQSSTPTTTTDTSTTSTGPFGPIDTGDGFPPLPQPYPRVVKIEERRISTPGAPRAQCTQVEIQGPGQEARPALDEHGRMIVIDIEETEPFMPNGGGGKPTATGTGNAGGAVGRRGDGSGGDGGAFPDISPCGCMWFLT